jgi:hypothetical protein
VIANVFPEHVTISCTESKQSLKYILRVQSNKVQKRVQSSPTRILSQGPTLGVGGGWVSTWRQDKRERAMCGVCCE